MSRTFADGFKRIARDMTTYALLGLNDWILVVDRIGFLEITRRSVTGIAIPAIGIHCGMHGIRWMTLGKINRIVIGAIVAITATRCVGWMHRIYKWIGLGKAACNRTIYPRSVGLILVTHAAICRCGNVSRRLCDHNHAIMRLAIMATGAITGDARSSMVKSWHCETGESSAMTYQTVLPRRRQRHMRQRLTGRRCSIMTGYAGRR